ncbi:MAG: hypothetical protein IPN13_14665 [Bacteroidetes bacterium]|nr:hypothetical protein [Bacteroidota bacterium]
MWNGSQWLAMGDGIPGGYVTSICILNGDVYVGGNFENAGGVPVKNIARWDGTSWHAVGSSPITYYSIMVWPYGTGALCFSLYGCTNWSGFGNSQMEWNHMVRSSTATPTSCLIYLHTAADTLFAYGGFTDLNGIPSRCAAAFVAGNVMVPMSVSPATISLTQAIYHQGTLFAIDGTGLLFNYLSGIGLNTDSVVFEGNSNRLFVYRDSLHVSTQGETLFPLQILWKSGIFTTVPATAGLAMPQLSVIIMNKSNVFFLSATPYMPVDLFPVLMVKQF